MSDVNQPHTPQRRQRAPHTPRPPHPRAEPRRTTGPSRVQADRHEVPTGAVTSTSQAAGWPGPSRASGRCGRRPTRSHCPVTGVGASSSRPGSGSSRRSGPKGNRLLRPADGIEPGEVALLNVTLPGRVTSRRCDGPLRRRESFTLMTPQGHMFAGWITFSATERDGTTVAQAQVLMRASDPIFELALMCGGHRQEDMFWAKTLTAVAARFGHAARGRHAGRVRGHQTPVVAVGQRPALVGPRLHPVHVGCSPAGREGTVQRAGERPARRPVAGRRTPRAGRHRRGARAHASARARGGAA
jgi:hypothetical protein